MVWSRALLLYLWEKHAQWSDCVETRRVLDLWHKGLYFQGVFEYQCWDMITPLAQPDHTPSLTFSPHTHHQDLRGTRSNTHQSSVKCAHIHYVYASTYTIFYDKCSLTIPTHLQIKGRFTYITKNLFSHLPLVVCRCRHISLELLILHVNLCVNKCVL